MMGINRTKLIIASQQNKYPGYLTFWSHNSFVVGCYNSNTSAFLKGWDGTMEYSTDTVNWNVWNDGSLIFSAQSNGNYYLYLRGTNNTYVTAQDGGVVYPLYKSDFSDLCPNMHITGNIEALLDYRKVLKGIHPIMSDKSFIDMFWGMSNLVEAPNLPSTTIKDWCYDSMFVSCTSLITIPKLPAITLKDLCYHQMFKGCTSLKFSETQTAECPNPYRIPTEGTGINATNALGDMFAGTSGTFTGTPSINTTYYTNATVI